MLKSHPLNFSRFSPPACLGLLMALAAFWAFDADAKVLWQGNFETGDLSQWSKQQSVSDDRLQVVEHPVAEGRYALKTRVIYGDDPIDASGNRNELVQLTHENEGDHRWYKWSTLWPDEYASAPEWQLFTQFHHQGANGSPPVELFVRGEEVVLRVNGDDLWTTPLERGAWHDFVLEVNWASDDGHVALWYDGQQVLAPTPAATLYPGQSVYLKQGLYRSDKIGPEQSIFHDGMTIADSADDVLAPGGGSEAGSAGDVYTTGEPISFGSAGGGGSCSSAGALGLLPLGALALRLRRRR